MLSRQRQTRDEVLEGLVGSCMASVSPEDAEAYLADFLSFATVHDAAECEAFAYRVREMAAWLRTQ